MSYILQSSTCELVLAVLSFTLIMRLSTGYHMCPLNNWIVRDNENAFLFQARLSQISRSLPKRWKSSVFPASSRQIGRSMVSDAVATGEFANDFSADYSPRKTDLSVTIIDEVRQQNWNCVDKLFKEANVSDFDEPFWDLLIKEAAKADSQKALKFFRLMKKSGAIPTTASPYFYIMRSLSLAENWREVFKVYEELEALGSNITSPLALHEYEILLSYVGRFGRWKEAMQWMTSLKAKSVQPSHRCYQYAIKACKKGGKTQLAMELTDELMVMLGDDLQEVDD